MSFRDWKTAIWFIFMKISILVLLEKTFHVTFPFIKNKYLFSSVTTFKNLLLQTRLYFIYLHWHDWNQSLAIMFFGFDKVVRKGLGCISASQYLSNHVPGPGYSPAEHMQKHTGRKRKSWYVNYRFPCSRWLSEEFITGLLKRTFWKKFYFIDSRIFTKDNSA